MEKVWGCVLSRGVNGVNAVARSELHFNSTVDKTQMKDGLLAKELQVK